MYKVLIEGQDVKYSDTIVYVKLTGNGSYVPCDQTEAAGFCVKLPITIIDEETEEAIRMVNDTVFAFPDKELKGNELTAEVEETAIAIVIDEALSSLQNAEIALIEGVESIG